jgi:hypothetical protein
MYRYDWNEMIVVITISYVGVLVIKQKSNKSITKQQQIINNTQQTDADWNTIIPLIMVSHM